MVQRALYRGVGARLHLYIPVCTPQQRMYAYPNTMYAHHTTGCMHNTTKDVCTPQHRMYAHHNTGCMHTTPLDVCTLTTQDACTPQHRMYAHHNTGCMQTTIQDLCRPQHRMYAHHNRGCMHATSRDVCTTQHRMYAQPTPRYSGRRCLHSLCMGRRCREKLLSEWWGGIPPAVRLRQGAVFALYNPPCLIAATLPGAFPNPYSTPLVAFHPSPKQPRILKYWMSCSYIPRTLCV